MEKKKILKQLEEEFNELTPSFQKIANYILINYKYIPAISSADLANSIGVSDASIVRFCQKLGYEGFIEFKNVLLMEINDSGKNPVDKMLKTIKLIGEDNKDYANLFQNELANLNRTIMSFEAEVLKAAVDEIGKAKKVYILGMGSCKTIADLVYYNFKRLGLNCETITYGGIALYDSLSRIEKNDAVIMISFPRYSIDSYNAMKHVHDIKAKSIIITDSNENKLAKLSDYVMIATSENPIYFYNSYVGPIALCNILVFEYFTRNKEKCLRHLENIKKLNKYYLK
ncbi:MAG TPA: MurR/RpiR family transcriptional regulator [Clostridia bacterium]|nr:MurR/RpiR family transcriptional regulator [Clostridia bacterium]